MRIYFIGRNFQLKWSTNVTNYQIDAVQPDAALQKSRVEVGPKHDVRTHFPFRIGVPFVSWQKPIENAFTGRQAIPSERYDVLTCFVVYRQFSLSVSTLLML